MLCTGCSGRPGAARSGPVGAAGSRRPRLCQDAGDARRPPPRVAPSPNHAPERHDLGSWIRFVDADDAGRRNARPLTSSDAADEARPAPGLVYFDLPVAKAMANGCLDLVPRSGSEGGCSR